MRAEEGYAIICILMNISLIVPTAIALYLASGLSIGLRLFRPSGRNKPPRALAIGLGFAAALLHALILYFALHTENGINLGFFNAGSMIAWTVIAILLISSLSKPVENLGIVLLPMAALAVLLEQYFPGQHLLGPDADWPLRTHVLTSLLAYSLLTLATVQAMLLAIQNKHLRGHHPGGFVRALPPLQTMETLLFELIAIGFAVLSIALATGFLYLDDMFAQQLAHKTILSMLAWLVFAILLWGRFRFGWRGRVAVRWTIIGFSVLMLAYFGSKFVLELMLNR